MFLKNLINDVSKESLYHSKIYKGYIVSKSYNQIILDFGLKSTFIFKITDFNQTSQLLSIGDACICEIENQQFLVKYDRFQFLYNYNFNTHFSNTNYKKIYSLILNYNISHFANDFGVVSSYQFFCKKKKIYAFYFNSILNLKSRLFSLYPYKDLNILKLTKLNLNFLTTVKNLNILTIKTQKLNSNLFLKKNNTYYIIPYIFLKNIVFLLLYIILNDLQTKLNALITFKTKEIGGYKQYLIFLKFFSFLYKYYILDFSLKQQYTFLRKWNKHKFVKKRKKLLKLILF